MPRKKIEIDLAERARFFNVCQRTIRRWIDAKVNVHSLESVADYLIKSKNPAPSAIKKILTTASSK